MELQATNFTELLPRKSNKSERRAKIRLFCLCTILCSVGMFNVSMSQGFLANAHHVMSEMMHDRISFTIGGGVADQKSAVGAAEMKVWWSALIALQHAGAVLGAFLFVVWDRQLGRLRTIVVVTLGFGVTGNVLKLIAGAVPHCWPMFFLGRVFSGIVEGVTICGVPVFICEISPKSVRSLLGMILPFGCAFNNIIVMVLGRQNVLGGPATWPYAYALNIASCTLVFPLALFLPPSPAYLLSRNDEKAARASIRYYHGSEAELDAARRDANVFSVASKGTPSFAVLRDKSLRRQVRLSIAIGAGYIICSLVTPFSTLMFEDAGFSLTAAANLSTGIRVQSLLVFLITLPLARLIGGNRSKFLIGTGVVSLTTAMLGAVNGLPSAIGISPSTSASLFAACLFVNQAAQDIGIRSLFYVLITEMYPYEHRAAGKSFSFIAFRLISFTMSLAFAPALFFSNVWTYIGCSIPLWLGFGYCFRHLGETGNKHLWEIHEMLAMEDLKAAIAMEERRPILIGKL